MAEAIIEVVKIIMEKPTSALFNHIMFVKALDSHTKLLQNSKSTIEATLADATSFASCSSHSQQEVLIKLAYALVKCNDLLDERAIRAKQKQLIGKTSLASKIHLFFSSSNHLVFRFNYARKIKAIREELELIARDYTLFGNITNMVSVKQTRAFSTETGPHQTADVVFGRDGDRDELINILCESSNGPQSLSVATIVGIGGLGKTTLAQYVYNDERIRHCFHVQLWVFATPDFSVREILEKIVASAIDEKPYDCEMSQLHHRTLRAIVGKKFLIVLDNVWDQDNLRANWLELKALLGVGANGSKVLITTRSDTVARIMGTIDPHMLNYLSENESWLLFQHFAYSPEQESGIEAIGEEIVEMCPKVPLVLKMIACHLAEKRMIIQWKAFRDELAANASSYVQDQIKHTLKLSYDQLHEKLKLCVAYCSLFPKGVEFDTNKMVRLWIALGYVESSRKQNLEDVGEEYVLTLVSRGFFHCFQEDEYGHLESFKMHDVMHDLMLSISRPQYQMVDSRTIEIVEGVHHVSFCMTNGSTWDVSSSILNIKQQLQSILMVESCYYNGTSRIKFQSRCDKLYSRFPYLKVLDLHGLQIEQVPRSLGELIHLSYLDLSDNCMKKLPNSITQLMHLLSLDLSRCCKLQKLPRDIIKMINLRHLHLNGCHSLSYMPKGLGNLTNLQTLDLFVVENNISNVRVSKGDNVGRLPELSRLNSLKRKLRIRVAGQSKNIVSEAKEAHLEMKDKLTCLTIEFHDSSIEDELVLECLQPGSNLKHLKIEGYGGVKLPIWMIDAELHFRLPKLVNIEICYYKVCTYSVLPIYPSYFVPSIYLGEFRLTDKQVPLVRIKIDSQYKHLHHLEWIPGFSKLKELTQGFMELDFTIDRGNLSGGLTLRRLVIKGQLAPYIPHGQHHPHFPLNNYFHHLHSLIISGINELQSFPDKFQDLNSLEYLCLHDCPKMKAIPSWIGNLTSLKTLRISDFPRLEILPHQISNLPCLKNLYVINLPRVQGIPNWIGKITSLEKLHVWDFPRLESLPHQMSNLNNLSTLLISGCSKVLVQRCKKPRGEHWPHVQHIRFVHIISSNNEANIKEEFIYYREE